MREGGLGILKVKDKSYIRCKSQDLNSLQMEVLRKVYMKTQVTMKKELTARTCIIQDAMESRWYQDRHETPMGSRLEA